MTAEQLRDAILAEHVKPEFRGLTVFDLILDKEDPQAALEDEEGFAALCFSQIDIDLAGDDHPDHELHEEACLAWQEPAVRLEAVELVRKECLRVLAFWQEGA